MGVDFVWSARDSGVPLFTAARLGRAAAAQSIDKFIQSRDRIIQWRAARILEKYFLQVLHHPSYLSPQVFAWLNVKHSLITSAKMMPLVQQTPPTVPQTVKYRRGKHTSHHEAFCLQSALILMSNVINILMSWRRLGVSLTKGKCLAYAEHHNIVSIFTVPAGQACWLDGYLCRTARRPAQNTNIHSVA